MDRDERLFVDGALTRARQLIRQKIWEGVDEARLTAWFAQFEARDSQLLGACLLDNFIYRSRAQVEAILRAAMCSPELLGADGTSDLAFIHALRGYKDPGIRLAPVIHLDQPPTKSGTYVLRRLVKSLQLRDKWAVWPQQLATIVGLSTVILVDDFCGSGQQFCDFVELTKFDELMRAKPDCRIFYLTVAAHADGVSKIRETFPRICVIAGEVLSNENHFFDGTVLTHIMVDGLIDRLRADHKKICDEVGLGGKKVGAMGFCDQGLTYAFDHGTPNNTLPIFWKQRDQWQPLVDR